MPERLVDVEKQGSEVLHTFPVTISTPAMEEEHAFKEKALEAAANAKPVPNEELETLNAKMHVGRGGQLTPYGDPHSVFAETKAGLDQVVGEAMAKVVRLLSSTNGWFCERLSHKAAASSIRPG
jgi:Mg2+ and Co2+ transporter CorA